MNKCEYCNEFFQDQKVIDTISLTKTKSFEVNLENSHIRFLFNNGDISYISINYCPLCGRKLKYENI